MSGRDFKPTATRACGTTARGRVSRCRTTARPEGRGSSGSVGYPARQRRGVAIITFVAALLITGTFVLWLFHLTAGTASSSLAHYYSMGAFYAAESGIEMGLRELNQSPPTDIDSDGLAGTISNNGNPNDDPALATGILYVERVGTTPPTYRATGRPVSTTAPWNSYRRVIEVRTQ